MYKNIILSFIFCVFLTSCPVMDDLDELPPDATLIIVNNSTKDILFYHSFDFPDTLINVSSSFFDAQQKKISTIYKDSNLIIPGTWRKAFENRPSNYKLIFFLFDKTVVETVPWETIKKNYLVLKRCDLNEKQLDSLNWTITYP